MALFIFTRGSIYGEGFHVVPKPMPRTGRLSKILDRFDTRFEAVISFEVAPTSDQLLAVHDAVGKQFGRKNVTIDWQTVCLRIGRSEFSHPRNRQLLNDIITGALYGRRLRVA